MAKEAEVQVSTASEAGGQPPATQTASEAVAAEKPPSLADKLSEALGAPEAASEAPTGQDAPTEPEAAAGASEKPADEAKPEGEEKPEEAKADEAKAEGETVEDPDEVLRKEMKEKTRVRFDELKDEVKSERAAREAAEQTVVQFQQAIQSTGAKPEEFGALMQYATFCHSNSPADHEQAFEFAKLEYEAWAKRLGRDVPGVVDVLADRPDLQEAVNTYQITREHAVKIAQADLVLRNQQEQGQRQAQERQMAEQFQQAEETVRQQFNTLGAQLAASDPDYAAKIEALKPRMEYIATLPPEIRVSTFRQFYDLLGSAPKPNNPRPKTPSPQPLRPNSSGGGGTPKPKTMAEAIEQGLTA